jgi:hypothetical protein
MSVTRQQLGGRIGHRAGFFTLAALLLATIALLPLALSSVIADLVEDGHATYFLFGDHQHQDRDRVMLNLSVTALDEWQRSVSMNVSGHRDCAADCAGTDRIQFISIPIDREDGEGLPPYAIVSFAPGVRSVSQQIQLPVSGQAIRYPFDTSGLRLGAVAQRSNADGGFRTLNPEDAARFLFLSVNGSIPRAVMQHPRPLSLDKVFSDDPVWRFAGVWQIDFTRPLYLQVVAVVLVVLVSLAATFAVALAPLQNLVVSAGGLILGLWGIRAIVLGANLEGYTIIDLSLMVIIMFLLVAITSRTLQHLHDRGELSVPPFRRKADEASPEAEGEQGQTAAPASSGSGSAGREAG